MAYFCTISDQNNESIQEINLKQTKSNFNRTSKSPMKPMSWADFVEIISKKDISLSKGNKNDYMHDYDAKNSFNQNDKKNIKPFNI